MDQENHISYIEFPTRDLEHSKTFFQEVFNWSFKDYSPGYASFKNAGIEGGFYQVEKDTDISKETVLVVLYSRNLETTLKKVQSADGIITKKTFSFPGGKRFEFREPGGNKLAVWSQDNE